MQSKRILLVEDDLLSRNALSALLRGSGYDVTAVSTVKDALGHLDATVDFIVLDLMLPDGDGADVLAKVRTSGLKTRVCVTTGVSNPAWLQRIAMLQPACVLRKPIDLAELLNHL